MRDEVVVSYLQFIINCCVSGIAAAFSKTMIAPIERTKLILQNQTSSVQVIKGEIKPYKGILDIWKRVPTEQGILSLWRGNSIAVMRYFPSQALHFSFYDLYKSILPTTSNNPYRKYGHKLLAGTAAGATSGLIIYPLESCQTRLAVDFGADSSAKQKMSKREYHNLRHCLKRVYKKAGLQGIYRGTSIAVAGIAIYRGLYFSLFETFKSLYWGYTLDNRLSIEKRDIIINFLLAQSSTTISGIVVYPLDTVGKRFLLDAGRRTPLRKYLNVRHTIREIYLKEGISGFYKGVFVNIIRGSAGALVLVIYDEFLYFTNWKEWLRKKITN